MEWKRRVRGRGTERGRRREGEGWVEDQTGKIKWEKEVREREVKKAREWEAKQIIDRSLCDNPLYTKFVRTVLIGCCLTQNNESDEEAQEEEQTQQEAQQPLPPAAAGAEAQDRLILTDLWQRDEDSQRWRLVTTVHGSFFFSVANLERLASFCSFLKQTMKWKNCMYFSGNTCIGGLVFGSSFQCCSFEKENNSSVWDELKMWWGI